MTTGGDGYPEFRQPATQDIMDQVRADYITAKLAADPGHAGLPGTDQLRGLQPGSAQLPVVGSSP